MSDAQQWKTAARRLKTAMIAHPHGSRAHFDRIQAEVRELSLTSVESPAWCLNMAAFMVRYPYVCLERTGPLVKEAIRLTSSLDANPAWLVHVLKEREFHWAFLAAGPGDRQ